MLLPDMTLLVALYGTLWLHNLYISLRSTTRTPGVWNEVIISGSYYREDGMHVPSSGSLWVTRSVVEGNPEPDPGVSTVRVFSVHSQMAVSGANSLFQLQMVLCGHTHVVLGP